MPPIMYSRGGEGDVALNGYAVDRASVRQSKTGRPVRFELTEIARQSLDDYLRLSGQRPSQCLFLGRRGLMSISPHGNTSRLVSEWGSGIGLDPLKYATHSMRRTNATLIYRRATPDSAPEKAIRDFAGRRLYWRGPRGALQEDVRTALRPGNPGAHALREDALVGGPPGTGGNNGGWRPWRWCRRRGWGVALRSAYGRPPCNAA
jgi:integrase